MRTPEQINKEFIKLCTEAGDLQYRIAQLSSRISAINTQLHGLISEQSEISRPKEEHLENRFPEIAP